MVNLFSTKEPNQSKGEKNVSSTILLEKPDIHFGRNEPPLILHIRHKNKTD